MDINYRIPQKEEAETFWELMNALDYETEYMLFEPGERVKNLSRMEMIIENAIAGKDFICIAEVAGNFVGYLSAQREMIKRVAHSAYVVVGIRKEFQNQGIGKRLFEQLDEWAKEQSVKRLELTVICENARAKHLYEKMGFQIEGTKKKSVLVDERFLDEFYMAKIYD